MKIYTKTGDNGTTGLWGGKRVKKSDKIIEALGTVDELIAWLGVIKLPSVQFDLMAINALLAGHQEVSREQYLVSRIQDLEWEIDKMQEKLPELRNFILPQNQIHIVRAVCRRAERAVVSLTPNHYLLTAIKYLNRLSDYLFVLARYLDWKKGKKELKWKNESWKSDDKN